jgi:MarR family transcriptional regulator, organic hydroperoxide resistance regulator
MSAKTSSKPDEPDTAILLAAANRVLTDRLLAAMDAAGLPMRPAWGYVIRALHARPLPLARLAELLDVTKQAAQQTVDDMQAAGLVERRDDPADRRRKLLALTAEGRRVRATALEVSRELEREIGPAGTRALRKALLGMVERHGDLEHVLARRSRALW